MSVDKKDHIINAAMELFAEKGFEGTSIRDIAAKADVNLAMVNYYFGSKEKLFEAMVEQKATFMRGQLEALESDKELTELEKVDRIIEAYVDRFLSNPGFHKVIQQEMLKSQREEMHQKAINIFIKNTQNFNSIIEKGIKKKVFKKVDPPLVFASIIGTINQVLVSKKVCNVFAGKDPCYDPYTDEHFKKRLLTHIKQMIHSHLLNQ
ncbi:MAG: TetR/AcrR family transcriptional regulator [Bacteroidota bacterium]|nr:TetR/AcrR family transcriptional regulator [Bacteroidota bacterium]